MRCSFIRAVFPSLAEKGSADVTFLSHPLLENASEKKGLPAISLLG